jgi:hypothetical protein
VSIREAAQLQVLLEGVPLPAGKQELIEYAHDQDDHGVASLLGRLPEREYGSLDEVGEELVPVQPERSTPDQHGPREESDLPPGGDAYTKTSTETGRVREHGPRG